MLVPLLINILPKYIRLHEFKVLAIEAVNTLDVLLQHRMPDRDQPHILVSLSSFDELLPDNLLEDRALLRCLLEFRDEDGKLDIMKFLEDYLDAVVKTTC